MKKKRKKIPKIKKKINAFLVGEEGKISKESLLKIGAVLGMVAVGSESISAQATHSNALNLIYDAGIETGSATHSSHGSHGSHSSHGSHGSHGSHNSW